MREERPVRLHRVISGFEAPAGSSSRRRKSGCKTEKPVILVFADRVIHRIPCHLLLLAGLAAFCFFRKDKR
jgi:hypothetical protein